MAQCSHSECRMFAHDLSIDNDRKIFNLPEIKRKYTTCFDVLHSNECKGLFSVVRGNIAHNDNLPAGARQKMGYRVNFSYPIYSSPRNANDLPLFGRRKRGGGRKRKHNEPQETDDDGNSSNSSNSESILFYDTSHKK